MTNQDYTGGLLVRVQSEEQGLTSSDSLATAGQGCYPARQLVPNKQLQLELRVSSSPTESVATLSETLFALYSAREPDEAVRATFLAKRDYEPPFLIHTGGGVLGGPVLDRRR